MKGLANSHGGGQAVELLEPPVRTLWWADERLHLIDQTRLPNEVAVIQAASAEEVWRCIRELRVRGAPAIGMAAAFGLYLGVRSAAPASLAELWPLTDRVAAYLASARPTAVNLVWALRRVQEAARQQAPASVDEALAALLAEAQRLVAEDHAVCLAIGRHGLTLLHDGMGLLTHCNAGGLGTAGWGTALAPIYLAARQGWRLRVFADETRPVLQGARLTAWELQQAGIPVTLLCDNMAAAAMARGWIQAVIVGTDRVAANGDVANKIGTYGLAVLAQAHGIPFYVAAPLSSVDLETPSGEAIPIEERDPAEVTQVGGRRLAPEGVQVWNPAFDVTPARFVTALITEVGVLRPPFGPALQEAVARAGTAVRTVRKEEQS